MTGVLFQGLKQKIFFSHVLLDSTYCTTHIGLDLWKVHRIALCSTDHDGWRNAWPCWHSCCRIPPLIHHLAFIATTANLNFTVSLLQLINTIEDCTLRAVWQRPIYCSVYLPTRLELMALSQRLMRNLPQRSLHRSH